MPSSPRWRAGTGSARSRVRLAGEIAYRDGSCQSDRGAAVCAVRKGMDGLAALVQEELKADPFSGVPYSVPSGRTA